MRVKKLVRPESLDSGISGLAVDERGTEWAFSFLSDGEPLFVACKPVGQSRGYDMRGLSDSPVAALRDAVRKALH
jgi:hypothetical protein